jgi:hypothetical protein
MEKSPRELFVYWVNEREKVRLAKERGDPKPWSQDKIFQEVYFTNIRREDDRVTRWLRANWLVNDRNYEFAMVVARLINKPETLGYILYPYGRFTPRYEIAIREAAQNLKPFWGNAYVVTTHGQRMDKVQYLLGVLEGAHKVLPLVGVAGTCTAYWRALQGLEGFGSFMAAQVVADLKNTVFHPLANAPDFWTFVAPGPGSKRGLEWYFGRKGNFYIDIDQVAAETGGVIPLLSMQDLQNCLCEFDKYMRVRNGTGRSKRKYAGSV